MVMRAADYFIVGCDNLLCCALTAGVSAGSYYHGMPFFCVAAQPGLYQTPLRTQLSRGAI